MAFETVGYERDGAVATITLNRPESFNSMSLQLVQECVAAMQNASEDSSIRAIVITGAGKAFCSGGDMKAAKEHIASGKDPQHFFRDVTFYLHRFITDIRLAQKPVIAAVNGAAGGAGWSLALACDLRIASEAAKFTSAYTAIALVPDAGLSYFLPRTVGLSKASDLIFRNANIDAATALSLNIVNEVVPADGFAEAVKKVANSLANGPTLSYAKVKGLLNASMLPELEVHLEREAQAITKSGTTADFLEGVAAFFEKRKPSYKGQ